MKSKRRASKKTGLARKYPRSDDEPRVAVFEENDHDHLSGRIQESVKAVSTGRRFKKNISPEFLGQEKPQEQCTLFKTLSKKYMPGDGRAIKSATIDVPSRGG